MGKKIVTSRFLVCLLLVLSCLVVFNLFVPIEVKARGVGGPLVRYFKALDEPNYDGVNATWESYPMEMLATQLPFELDIPKLAGWILNDDQEVLYTTSYTKRFFHSVYLKYQKDGVDLNLTVALNREPFLARHRGKDTFLYKGVRFNTSEFTIKIPGRSTNYEQVQWQQGDIYYGVTVDQKGLDIESLTKECFDQLNEIIVQPEKIECAREEEKYLLRATYEEISSYFSERVFDMPQLGDYIRSDRIIFGDIQGNQILQFTYNGGKELRFSLMQTQRSRGWKGQETIEKDGVTVQKDSFKDTDYDSPDENEVHMKTTYVLWWSIDGYHFELFGSDEEQLWKALWLINVLVRSTF